MTEQELHILVSKFEKAARPAGDDPAAPATVEDMNRLVAKLAETLDNIISGLYRK